VLITGGADFIGSALIRHTINNTNHSVVNVDKLTYAGNVDSSVPIENDLRYVFADHLRKNGTWSVPSNIPKPSGYIGKPVKEVFVGGISYQLYDTDKLKDRNIFFLVK
jgi:hypothetical protein